MAMSQDLDRLDREYETAEALFIDAVRRDAPRSEQADAVRAVAIAAAAWNTEAYRHLHASEGAARGELDLLTERTELLEELWQDVAAAFGG
jgi:hypothetical protein